MSSENCPPATPAALPILRFPTEVSILFDRPARCNRLGAIPGVKPGKGTDSMEKTRLQMITEALQASPENAFLRFGLAMELKNAGRDDEAWKQFEHLLAHHPDYWATYLHAGMLLVKMQRRDEARQVMARGVEVTGRLKNSHAQSELQAALDDLDA